MNHFTKQKIFLRSQLIGMAEANHDWFRALRAFEFAENMHTGMRKDGVTPEFAHQVQISLLLMNHLRYMIDPVGVITAALLHDVREDYDIDDALIKERFGARTAEDVAILTKKFRGTKRDSSEVFASIAANHNASLVKGADRVNNLGSMSGVFDLKKQIAYCEETRTEFFKFLKAARRSFPEQTAIYESFKLLLNTQIDLYGKAHSQGFAL